MYEFGFIPVQKYGNKNELFIKILFERKKLPIIRQLEEILLFVVYIVRFV